MILLASVASAPAAAEVAPYREERVPIALANGQSLSARLRFPAAQLTPLPAVMLFGGFQGAAEVLDRVHTDQPIVFATFDYPYDAPRRFVFPDSLAQAPQMRAAIHGTLEGVGKLHQVLRTRADVDPKRITVAGASAGAPVATIAAARHRIPGLVVVHGFGQITRVVAHQFERKFEPRLGRYLSRALAWPLAWFCTWYTEAPAPESYAAQLGPQQKVLMISATADSFIPAESSAALWQALERSSARREHLRMPGDHVGRSVEELARILERALDWLRRNDLAAPAG